ncbi:cytochrome P450 [Dothidotthia symphoricarpi CBS 119687]|uniref:Cytochrome P450 n=1 Tax=Dothidotthia symphoricarpi CBS 119687 TaxID=1392245 RepID=A0A6A6A0I7_9PLEO|nr:cytochrome P450 [Dothidotthia symphoricarpi CBS 119687]KAF2124477.1 cytochrome P450 [Dothidotthia symphoricarpi CBS 119687]
MTLTALLVKAFELAVIALVGQYVLAYKRSPLKKIPGPFLAKFSDIWRLVNHYGQTHIETQKKLHEKHGDVVRLGPNTVSIADPNLIKTIYSTRGTFPKSEYYSVNDALQNGHLIQNLFSTRDNEFHSRTLKPVQKLYSLSNALQLETLMNEDLHVFRSELETRFMQGENEGKTCDLADWISYFAWDFLGDMTWSKRMGFMEQGKDVGNMLATAENVMRYFSVVGQIPALDKLLGKNAYSPYIHKFDDFSVAAGAAVERFMERMQDPGQFKGKKDFLNDFLQAKEDNPTLVTDNEVIGYMIINILGGADTLAIVIKAIFYHILKSPRAKQLLVSELRSANLSDSPSYSTLEVLPYLDACIKEGLRMHPVVGHILERIVPASGLTLADGTILPPGTIVGVNPWVVHYKSDIFGPQVNEFRPERWLREQSEGKEEFEFRIKKMKDADLSFGGGNRVCLGRPLALVELYKVVATMFRGYEIELEDPSKEWELSKQWFVWPHKIRVKMSPSRMS